MATFHKQAVLVVAVLFALLAGRVAAADQQAALALFSSGQYQQCLDACTKAVAESGATPNWWSLKIRCEMTTGQYAAALNSYGGALSDYPEDLPLRFLGYDVLRVTGQPQAANAVLSVIHQMAAQNPRQYSDPASRVVLGKILLIGGADPRQVLELFFDVAKRDDPAALEPHLASGELALAKSDFALAAESFAEALKLDPENADIHFGMARAFADDSDRAAAALAKTLELNPNHVAALLFQAENLVDREEYDRAGEILQQVLKINPKQSDAWAYRAVLAHLAGATAAETEYRAEALSTWTGNPQVDHLIGKKLSQKYRFAEGQSYQRRALMFDPGYLPAMLQLCQDLLRLGREDDGWKLAAEVFARDKYNVHAYNLVTLHDTLAKFRTLQSEHFLVRMENREADIYGQRTLQLLEQARQALCEKYGVELTQPIVVEIFPRQGDFAIRTFGLPGGAGYLGVCFGPVVTVNSPASRPGRPSNWQAILWHEFCHVVTLHKTRNKMPRWLSEGISVYEERQRNRGWGQAMNPQYRQMILDGHATPLSQLSGAFLKATSGEQVQFAYFESSMAVQFLIERYGMQSLQNILDELGNSLAVNDALAKHTEPVEKLDADFAAWLKTQAQQLAPDVDWTRPDLPLDADSAAMAAWNQNHPNSFYGLLGEGRALLAERKFDQAKSPLETAAQLFPAYAGPDGPFVLLAQAHRELGETDAERAMLEKHIELNGDTVAARLRLCEIAAERGDWNATQQFAEQVLAIDPLTPAPHRHLAQAAEKLGDRASAIHAIRTLLLLQPFDRAQHHYQLATLLLQDQQPADARRNVLEALEEAPRFRDAHRLLLQIVRNNAAADTSSTTAPATQPLSTK